MTSTAPADIDASRLGEYLRGRLDGAERHLSVHRLAGGQSNPTYRLQAGARAYALRTKPAPAALLLPSAHQIEREYRVLQALATSAVPVPTPHVLCTDEAVIGRAFYVMEFVEGRVFVDPRLPELSAAQRGAVFDEMNRVMAALHQLDWRALGLEDFGKPGDYLRRQIARWSRQYRASETETIEAMDRLIEWLPVTAPPADETALVHGDFRLDNLVFDARGERILAVLDWELSTLGSPLADFAYHCCVWHFPVGLYRGLAGVDCPDGIPCESDYRVQYANRVGRAPIEHWDYYIAYNFFRMAAIVQGILKRAQEGTAAATDADAFGRGARRLAQSGWARLERLLAVG
jgi:aminoglycoside phosphotransferase (APT) family kinase protein